MESILFLSYYFPPIKSIGVIRNYNVAKHILPHFPQVFVLTTSNNQYLEQEPLPTNQFQVHNIPTLDYRTIAIKLKKRQPTNQQSTTQIHFSETTKQSKVAKTAIKLINTIPISLIIGEGGIIYTIASLYKAIQLIKKHNIQHIYSSYRPYSDHFTAYLLKIRFPNLHWTADFRDLHIDPLYQNVYLSTLQHWFNRQILKKANLVTTVSLGLATQLQKYGKEVQVLRNGISNLNLNPTRIPPIKFTIAYTGSMYGEERNPQLLLQVLSDLINTNQINPQNTTITYAGKDTSIWQTHIQKHNLQNIFQSLGSISLQKANELQQNAHINLLLTSALPNYTGILTGKFYEYLAAQNPIIVLINGAQDPEFQQIVQDLQAGIVINNQNPTSYQTLKDFLLTLYNQFQTNGDTTPTIQKQKLQQYQWENTIKPIAQKMLNK
jgi:hypothetical protein